MKTSKILKAISYILLSITIVTCILSVICIVIKNSEYFNEEKYFESDSFSYDYIMTLRNIADNLIHNNSSYSTVKDGDIDIYYAYDYNSSNGYIYNSYNNRTELKNLNFLIIYKNKAITNINANTVEEIKQQINQENSTNEVKNVNIVDSYIQSDSEAMKEYGEKYLNNFLITYYTTDTNKTDILLEDGRYIEYILTDINDFEIYSSYNEELKQNSARKLVGEGIKLIKPINDNAYVILPITAILTILLIIYLVNVIGHDDKEDAIKINSFDKIPIEIIIIASIIISVMPICILIAIESDYFDVQALTSIGITTYFIIYICVAVTMTTIIKRIKSKQVLKTSILGQIFLLWLHFCKKIINKIKDIWKTLTYSTNTTAKIIISAGVTIFFWIVVMVLSRDSGILLILIIISIAVAIYKIIKLIKEYSQVENKLKEIYEGNNKNELNPNEFGIEFKNAVTYLNDISNGFENAVQERMKSERMKAELITNVSHDIKTPLTSIINYVDLLKHENIQDKKVKEYIEILNNKAQRLKKLTEDLVEASKVSTGNISLKLEKINIVELIKQATGEFEDKLKKRNLEPVINYQQDEINIMADSKYMYRIIENLYSNISKYALENSRVYIDIKCTKQNRS